jgi:ABC-2 type transport system permease protein
MMTGLVTIYAIWLRESMTFWREKGRIVGMIGQPLLYLLILGNGITAGMKLNSAGNVGYIQFLYPGVIAMSILFTSIFSAISIIWDREFGFMKEVLVAPVPRWGVAMGKAFGGATVAMVQAVIMVAMAPLVGISLSVGVILQILLLAFLMSVAVTSLGIAVAARMSSMQGFQMVMNFLVMPIYFLSGAMFPLTTAPVWLKSLMTVDPLTYGVDAIRNVVFSRTTITIQGSPQSLLEIARRSGLIHSSLGYDVLLMTLVTVTFSALGIWSFSRTEAG